MGFTFTELPTQLSMHVPETGPRFTPPFLHTANNLMTVGRPRNEAMSTVKA